RPCAPARKQPPKPCYRGAARCPRLAPPAIGITIRVRSLMLQRSSPVPLYQQLKLLLADRIQRGVWKPGELIPGEHELQAIHRLSRTTVRQALQELEREGYVTRHRGRGTFVAQPGAVHD